MKAEKAVTMSTEESIKKDNKKAGWKFVIILILSGLVGGIIGFLSVGTSKRIKEFSGVFEEFMIANMSVMGIVVPIIMLVLLVLIMIWCMSNIRYCKKEAPALIDVDDEEGIERLETKLSYNIWGTSILMILYFLMFSVMIFVDFKYSSDSVPENMLLIAIVFLAGIILITVLQQKIIDCVRLINPEKQGSVYDVNFNKKWEASCDEAEKLIIYKAAYKAYKAASMTCLVLWVIFMLLGMTMGVGFLAVIAVIIIWTVLICVSSYYTIKYSK